MTTLLINKIDFIINYIKLFCKLTVLSLYSSRFYRNVYKNFNGWGIKYIFTAIFVANLIYALSILSFMKELENYFAHDILPASFKDIDYIINQFPEVKYDGNRIAIDWSEPYYIYDLKGNAIALIDNKAKPNNKEKIIFTSNEIIFNFRSYSGRPLSVEYNKILGNKPILLNTEKIKLKLGQIIGSGIKLFVYIVFPISLVIALSFFILQKVGNIIIIYVFLNMFIGKSTFQAAFRLVMFALPFPVLLGAVPLQGDIIKNIAIILELWTLMLLVFSLHQTK